MAHCGFPMYCGKAGKSFEKAGGDDGTRTRGLCRDRVTVLGFTTTYKDAGTAKVRVSRTRHRLLWVRLWVGKSGEAPPLLVQRCQPAIRAS